MSIPLKNTRERYGLGAIALHWVMALTIIGLYPLGLYIETLDYYDPAYRTIPHWHKSIGLLLAGLLILRLLWRLVSVQPVSLEKSTLLRRLAHIAHWLLYLLLAVALASGYMISTADGRPIDLFNWFQIPALPALIDNQEDLAGDIHYIVTTALISLAGLHALAALKHHFINKDDTLTRMLGMHQETRS